MSIKGKNKIELTTEAILGKISDFDIFHYYMPYKGWKLNEVCLSPFREEKNPSFVIGNKRGFISFIDFADSEKRGDCFQFVKNMFNLSTLNDVLEKIDTDFGLGIRGVKKDYEKITKEYKQPEVTKRNTLIQVKTRAFTHEELAYWNEYHQDITDLRRNNIYSIKELYLNRKKFPLKDTELRFAYMYDDTYFKIYRPFAGKKEKWFPNNTPITALDGKENIKNCQTAFINKSKKDKMVVEKVFPCSIGVQNEGIACFSIENVEYIKSNSVSQILSFDSDVTGVKNSQQITELFGFGYCNVPRKYLSEGIKDWSDLAKAHGLKAVEQVLKEKGIL